MLLIPQIYKEVKQLNNNKTNNSIKSLAWPEQTFFQGRHTDEKRYMKRCLTTLVIRKMQIKTTMTHLKPT